MDCYKWTEVDPCTGEAVEKRMIKPFASMQALMPSVNSMECGGVGITLNEAMRACYTRPKNTICEELERIENCLKKGREDLMGNGMSLGMVMKLVDNTTPVRIDVNGEEMALTPHRLALYAPYEVRKMFINCQAELEMELEDR